MQMIFHLYTYQIKFSPLIFFIFLGKNIFILIPFVVSRSKTQFVIDRYYQLGVTILFLLPSNTFLLILTDFSPVDLYKSQFNEQLNLIKTIFIIFESGIKYSWIMAFFSHVIISKYFIIVNFYGFLYLKI